jgi:hypothetical protein
MTKKKEVKKELKAYKERAEYLSFIVPQNAQIYRAIADFFGKDEIPPKKQI